MKKIWVQIKAFCGQKVKPMMQKKAAQAKGFLFPAEEALRKKRQIQLAIAAGVCVVFAVWGVAATVPKDAKITANGYNSAVLEEAYFKQTGCVTLLFAEDVPQSYLQKNLVITPTVPFELVKVSNQVYSLFFPNGAPEEELEMRLKPPSEYLEDKVFVIEQTTANPQPEKLEATVAAIAGANTMQNFVEGSPFVLVFSDTITADKVRKATSFVGTDKMDIVCKNNVAVLTPQDGFQADHEYIITVDSDVMVSEAGRQLQLPIYSIVKVPSVGTSSVVESTRPPLSINLMRPSDGLALEKEIILVFSEEISQERLEQHLHISRVTSNKTKTEALPFRLQCNQNVAIVYPQDLEYQTEYLVTVQKGFTTEEGGRLSENKSFSVFTKTPDFSLNLTNKEVHSVPQGKPIVMEYELTSSIASQQLADVSVYRFANVEQYQTALQIGKMESSFGLTKISSQSLILKEGLNTLEMAPIESEGNFFLIQTSYINPENNRMEEIYRCINLVALSVYMQTVNAQTMLWVNNIQTGGAAQGYRAEFSDRKTGDVLATATIDAEGIATMQYTFAEDVNEFSVLLTIFNPQGVPVYIDTTENFGSTAVWYNTDGQRYYSFLYLDRSLYRPTDTIQFWGYVKPHHSNTVPLPSTVEVVLDEEGLNQSVEVKILPDGTFSGSIGIEQVKSSQYLLTARIKLPNPNTEGEEDKTITQPLKSQWIEVKDFDKPLYVINTKTDKEFYFAGDTINVIITPTFYDGTPLPNYPLEVSFFDAEQGNVWERQSVTTDKNGEAVVSIKPTPTQGAQASNMPKYQYYTVELNNDGQSITYQGKYAYLTSDTLLKTTLTPTAGNNLELTIQAAKVDSNKPMPTQSQWDKLVEEGQSHNNLVYDLLAGEPQEVDVTGEFVMTYRTATGEYKNGDTRTVIGKTQGGKLVFTDIFETPYDPRDFASASVYTSYIDNNLNMVTNDCGWYNDVPRPEPPQENDTRKGYTLSVFKNNQTTSSEMTYDYIDYNSLTAGDKDVLRFVLHKDTKPVPAGAGKILYTIVQDKIGESQIVQGTSFSLVESVAYADSIYVVCAYFDGKEVFPIRNTRVSLDVESIELDVEVSTDKNLYRPGEKATVQVRVTDQNGTPVQSKVCIGVVDESVFALRDQSLHVTQSLYDDMNFPLLLIKKYTTTQGDIPFFQGGGDGGKGGMDMTAYDIYRKNFKDTAHFIPLTTSAQGMATTTFTLPDNLTEWRITAACIGNNLYAGQTKGKLIAALPFFASPILSSKYIEGDEVTMLLQGHGNALDMQRKIKYTVTVTGDQVNSTFEAEGAAYQPVTLMLGKLAAGEYSVVSTAEYGIYKDTVELPLAVISSNLELVVHQKMELDEVAQAKVVRFPVVLSIYDKEHEAFYKSINTLMTHYCYRADQRMSRFAAKRALSRYCNPDEIPQHIREGNNIASEIQNEDGGIGWYVGEPSDPILTTKILLFAQDQFRGNSMAKYFEKITKNTTQDPIEVAAAYAGLAALNSEATKEIHNILKTNTTLSMQEKLYYIVGLAAADDTQSALDLYNQAVTPYLEAKESGKWMAYTGSATENDALSATAWIAATLLNLEDADSFALYFADNRWGLSTAFECMIYVTNYSKTVAPIPNFSYTAAGQTKQIALGITGQTSLTLNKSEFESLSFQDVPPSVTAMAYYIGEPSEADIKPSDDLSIQKTITPNPSGSYTSTLTVRFSKDAPIGNYDVSDWIPSNMRLSTAMAQEGDIRYTQEGQKMYIELYRADTSVTELVLSYEIRRTYDTKAVIDRAYIIHADSGVNAFSEKSIV